MVFRGGPVLTLDGKGRITVPARWRDVLMANVQGQMVVTKNPDGCLSLYPMPVWEAFENNVLALTTEDDAWRRFFIGSATEVELDGAARVLIPPELRAWAGLELWDSARHDAREAEALAKPRPDALRSLVIR
jgi:MraZ protein